MTQSPRPFSLPVYLLIVIAISWPFQLVYVVLGDNYRPILLISMIGAGVGTWVAGRFVFRDGFSGAGWRPGHFYHYLAAFVLALILWLLPIGVERFYDMRSFPVTPSASSILLLFLTSFALTVVPAFGEEFSWRGYLLPQLLNKHSRRKALLIHGFITWFWHLPFLIATGLQLESDPLIAVVAVLLISLIPAVMHAIVFAWFWSSSASLFVATFYHIAFDEVRDTLQTAFGFGFLSENWQMLVLTVLGIVLLARVNWLKENTEDSPHDPR